MQHQSHIRKKLLILQHVYRATSPRNTRNSDNVSETHRIDLIGTVGKTSGAVLRGVAEMERDDAGKSFMIDGQLNLMQRCVTYDGRHEFVTQKGTAGPNVFVDCVGFNSNTSAGPHHRYSVGTLFDNVKSEKPMESRFRGNSGTGHGWAGTQTCFYNCVAPGFNVEAPPGGISWVIGSGNSDEKGTRVSPSSLYYQQVRERLGKAALDRLVTEQQLKHMGKYLWVAELLKNEKEQNSPTRRDKTTHLTE
ncbi:MAG: hypothetical protein GY903_14285 [Fuerstiella sp.]|nr:hypothetical protein [Fuerstiella sp.]MCP4855655.1 hypothetical protein [Fuerstiella sp.]